MPLISWNNFPYSLLHTAFQQYCVYPPQPSSDHCLCHHSKNTLTFLLLPLCHKFCLQRFSDSCWCCNIHLPSTKMYSFQPWPILFFCLTLTFGHFLDHPNIPDLFRHWHFTVQATPCVSWTSNNATLNFFILLSALN